MAIDFKGFHFPKSVILYAVFLLFVIPFLIVIFRRSGRAWGGR